MESKVVLIFVDMAGIGTFFIWKRRGIVAVVANADVKYYAMQNGVKLWQLAKELGYKHPNALSVKMRTELSEHEKDRFMEAIDNVVKKGLV